MAKDQKTDGPNDTVSHPLTKPFSRRNFLTGTSAAGLAGATTPGAFTRAAADAVEDAIWSATRDTGTGYGLAVFDVDPGHEGGKTSITINHYHAPGADKVPTPTYELFETTVLSKHAKRGRHR